MYVSAEFRWPEGATDAAYNILENVGTDENGDAYDTTQAVCKAVQGTINNPETQKWMKAENVTLNVSLNPNPV